MDSNTTCYHYEIRVKDHLDPRLYAWFEEWAVTNLEDGIVLLQSGSIDQAGLHGALNKIRDLNLVLISVARILPQDSNG